MNQEREIGARFKHIHDKFTQHMNQKLRCLNVTYSQMELLLYLAEHQNRKITQKDIGEFMRVKHSTVIGILRRLETKGFLYCVVDEENKRCRNVILTQKGLDLKSEMEVHLREEEMRIRKALSEEESQRLCESVSYTHLTLPTKRIV